MSTASSGRPGFTADQLFRLLTAAFATFIAILFIVMLGVLWHESQPAIDKFGFSFLTSSDWNPVSNEYGALIAIIGTLLTTLVAMLVALPVSLGIALFLAEISPYWLRKPVGTAIELLAAIPSIVYGMWGLFVIVPIMADTVQPWLYDHFSFMPLFSTPPIGIGILTAGLVLALMIIPFIASITRDVFLMCPQNLKESAYGLGATNWEVVKDVMIPYGIKGIVGAIFLGLGRALGETMAVTFVIGNAYHLSWSLLAPGNSIASTLANEFTEADGKLYTSALIELGLVLFLITFIVLSIAEFWLHSTNKKRGA
ncbi:phosphate ABC transporter permease subunit PstC [Mariprofundus ferrooxydans]|uniref:Phosphate transport system permease protein n=1 Tax=Mariprofundus ferrooxydans PV-1 TaxID=314345 RepID=Q0F0D2_9PROT|nr:phosphate ABC transporter permease subunit PstC [Mariprofundus ferrooxydans]EAU55096.1 phosphate ABC transporter, permease protein [Mariprofundus ferrooxydans PV-1]KON46866.1 phosphate ABC transporter permease [Mariprofundus ferrooxydans]